LKEIKIFHILSRFSIIFVFQVLDLLTDGILWALIAIPVRRGIVTAPTTASDILVSTSTVNFVVILFIFDQIIIVMQFIDYYRNRGSWQQSDVPLVSTIQLGKRKEN
jgi:hypothetical protein